MLPHTPLQLGLMPDLTEPPPLPPLPCPLPCRYEQYCMDEFPNGTNAIVAVLAYTGGWVRRKGCLVTLQPLAGALLKSLPAPISRHLLCCRSRLVCLITSRPCLLPVLPLYRPPLYRLQGTTWRMP